MKALSVSITNVQGVRSLQFTIGLESPRICCLVGKNGVGKTTLVRALGALARPDIFLRTAGPHIVSDDSRIDYVLDDQRVSFQYDKAIGSLESREPIPGAFREGVIAELPLPHGMRFNFFRAASDADADIRAALATGDYSEPVELRRFLEDIYSRPFHHLVEVMSRGRPYYCLRLSDERYIREDYLSSGEYFLISLYRVMRRGRRLIVVDEIEISLDAAAQSRIVGWLRGFCLEYGCSIVLTSHSLPVMRSLDHGELIYLDSVDGEVTTEVTSFGQAQLKLFGINGRDRVILTEDAMLAEFLRFLVASSLPPVKLLWDVVHVGGGAQVVDFLERNATHEYLASGECVIAVLDGDQLGRVKELDGRVYFVPFASVEKAIYSHYYEDDFPYRLAKDRTFTSGKDCVNSILQARVASRRDLLDFLRVRYERELGGLTAALRSLLCPEPTAEQSRPR